MQARLQSLFDSRWVLVVFMTLFFAVQVSLGRLVLPSLEKKYLNPPPQYLEYFTFGFKWSVADSFWLRWIQDSDYCQTYTQAQRPTTPEEKSKYNSDSLTWNPRHRVCDNSWAFLMLDTITRIDPKFEMAYQGGAIMLSVLVEDYAGATVIFERGLKAYPDDWRIAYLAAYHYIYDLQDPKRGAELTLRSGELGGPWWLKSLAARLYSRTGQYEMALKTLESYRQMTENEEQRAKIDERISELKRKLAQAESQEPAK